MTFALLLITTLISSCGNLMTHGEAQNSVDGAVLYADEGFYVNSESLEWDEALVGKIVQAKVCILSTTINTEDDLRTEDGLSMAGRPGKTYYVKVLEYHVAEN